MPAIDAFLDSCVLVYAMSDAPGERQKRDKTYRLLESVNFATSYQVLMETWVASRKMARPPPEAKVFGFLETILEFPCVECTPDVFRKAFELAGRYRIHPYDAAILAAALELGTPIVYSEDMNHGQDYGGVRVLNPFRE